MWRLCEVTHLKFHDSYGSELMQQGTNDFRGLLQNTYVNTAATTPPLLD
jgi:hypothetical protein